MRSKIGFLVETWNNGNRFPKIKGTPKLGTSQEELICLIHRGTWVLLPGHIPQEEKRVAVAMDHGRPAEEHAHRECPERP